MSSEIPFEIATSVKVNLNSINVEGEGFENENDDSDDENCAVPEVEAKIDPDGHYHYVGDEDSDNIQQFQLTSDQPVNPIRLGRGRKRKLLGYFIPALQRRNKYAHLTSNLVPWKEKIVIRVLSKLDKIRAESEPPRTGPLSPDEDPRRRYLMEYDSENEVFIINGTFHASFQDEGMVCHTCGLLLSKRSRLEHDMFDHVLSTHLNVYKCSLDECGRVKEMPTFESYKSHLASNRHQRAKRSALEGQPASANGKGNCVICGESFYLIYKPRGHPGAKTNLPPHQRFPCLQCGIILSTKKLLTSHSNRMTYNQCRNVGIKCDKCGIYYTAGVSFINHKNKCYFDNKACRKCSANATLKQEVGGEFVKVEVNNADGEEHVGLLI